MFCVVIFVALLAATCGQKERSATHDIETYVIETLRANQTTNSNATNTPKRHYSADEIESLLIESYKKNETFNFNDYVTDPCGPFVNEKPNFTAPRRRISEAKCLEYIWEMENREKEEEWNAVCQLYLIAEIKRGVFPQVLTTFIQLNSPVIYGGRGAAKGEFPHMGAVGWPAKNSTNGEKWVFKCGSTLISEKFLITAAHCSKLSVRRVRDIARSEPEVVRLGVENIEYNEFNMHGIPVNMKIKRIIVHPKYSPPKKYFDIALIELGTEVVFTNKLQPACIWPKKNVNRLGKEGTLTGWGYTEKGELSPLLQAADVDFIDSPFCDNTLRLYRNRNWNGVRQHQMCAGKLQGGIDTCQGDSGGPLQVLIPTKTEGKIYYTVAVTSFGYKCGFQNRPGVYTRISSFINWIERIVWGSKNKTLSSQS